MAEYICIDGGTTNTRLRLVKDKTIVDSIRLNLGVNAASSTPTLYKQQLKDAITTLLSENNTEKSSISRILASGMITSELGLYALEHAEIPAGICELHDNMAEVLFPDISAIPFVFIRGLKKNGENASETDIMRGEETELTGILEEDNKTCCTYILPGSHTKVIHTDAQGKIVDFFTTLTGEMISSLAGYTILQKSVDLTNSPLEEENLIAGYEYCLAEGLNKALFKVRIADTIFKQDTAARYSFFLGAVLCGDITAILKKATGKIVIGGREQLKKALYILLKRSSELEITCLPQEEIEACVALGAIRIYEYKRS